MTRVARANRSCRREDPAPATAISRTKPRRRDAPESDCRRGVLRMRQRRRAWWNNNNNNNNNKQERQPRPSSPRQPLLLICALLLLCQTPSAEAFWMQHLPAASQRSRAPWTPSWERGSSSSTPTYRSLFDSPTEVVPEQEPQLPSPTDRFHADMNRILEARRHWMNSVTTTTPATAAVSAAQTSDRPTTAVDLPHRHSRVDRQHRPTVLTSDEDGAERVHGLLKILCQRGLATEESFQIVMRAYVNRGRLRWRPSPHLAGEGTSPAKSTLATTTTENPRASSTPKVICAADQVEVLLTQVLKRFSGSREVSMETYNLVLEAYANCATPRWGERNNYAQRAQTLHQRLSAMYGEDNLPAESLLHVLHATAWQQANLQPGIYAAQAAGYLQQICQSSTDPAVLLPAYGWTLEAYSKSGSSGSATEADRLLTEMKRINATATSSDGGWLDAQDYSNAILAWSKGNHPEAAERSQALLEEMVDLYQQGRFPTGSEPPLIAFNGVIVAWSRRGEPDKAAAVLQLLDQVRRVSVTLVPDVVSYNSVLHAYYRSKAPVDKAVALVKFMEDRCDEIPSIRPNSFTYYNLLKCLLQARPNQDSEGDREKLLSNLEKCWSRGDFEMEPTNRIYNMIINAYAKSKEKRSWRKAMHLLEHMQELSTTSESLAAVAPDIITVTSVMECLSKASDNQAPQLAQSLLQDAFDRYQETRDNRDRPNLRTFTMAILTLCKNHGSVVQARQLLDQLIALYEETKDPSLEPNAYPYNYVLNCAATTVTDDPLQSFQIATQTFREMREAKLVDSFTYAFWFKCCVHLVTDDALRLKCIKYAFDECKRDGLVTPEVLARLFQALPRSIVLAEMLEGKVDKVSSTASSPYAPVAVHDLPAEWSRGAAQRKR